MSCGKPPFAAFPQDCPHNPEILIGCKISECEFFRITDRDILTNSEYNPLVSVIMPYRNNGYVVDKAIQSVVNQQYKNWELIIVDDGSEEWHRQELIKEVESIVSDNPKNIFRIKVLHMDHSGQAHARNVAFCHSVGQYIAYLDSDDEWKEDHLITAIKILLSEDAEFVYGNFSYKYIYGLEPGSSRDKKKFRHDPETIGKEPQNLKLSNFMNTCTVVHESKWFIPAGGFETGVVCGEDGVLWRRMSELGIKIAHNPRDTVFYCRYNRYSGCSVAVSTGRIDFTVSASPPAFCR